MEIWNALGRTDPAHTKSFKRAGGFTGTAVKPQWAFMRMTEFFGPCGVGWGMDKPEFQLVESAGEILVYCTINMWYKTAMDHTGNVYGIGGDKVVSQIFAKDSQGQRVRKEDGQFLTYPQTDDEAYKKAYTDALSNAMKFIGVAADVHMGQFDDNKYVRQVAAEFDEAKKAEVNAEIDRQKAASNIGPASGKGDAGIEARVADQNLAFIPPELDWLYNRASGVLICRIMEAKVGKIKTGNNAGKEYVILTVNNELDKGKKPDLFYWHATHREALLAAKGKVVKLLILAKEKGFTVDAVMEIDGKKMASDPVVLPVKDFAEAETQARLLASNMDWEEEDIRQLFSTHGHGSWPETLVLLERAKAQQEGTTIE